MEDFVTWVDTSKLKRTVMAYNDEVSLRIPSSPLLISPSSTISTSCEPVPIAAHPRRSFLACQCPRWRTLHGNAQKQCRHITRVVFSLNPSCSCCCTSTERMRIFTRGVAASNMPTCSNYTPRTLLIPSTLLLSYTVDLSFLEANSH